MAYGVRNGQEFKGMWAWAMGRCLWTMGWGEGGMGSGHCGARMGNRFRDAS